MPEGMRRFALHWRCHAAVEGETPTPEALRARRAYRDMLDHGTSGQHAAKMRSAYQDALQEARAAELRGADIVFTTCVSCRRFAITDALAQPGAPEFHQVIIDEAGQATEPEALCPLTFARRARQICLFGDHKQLRPILKSQRAEAAGLAMSLFERLATSERMAPRFLAQQYRMHPEISRFPSLCFYDGRLRDDESVFLQGPGLLCGHESGGAHLAFVFWDVDSMEAAASLGAGGYREEVQQTRTAESGTGSRSHAGEAARAVDLAVALAAAAGPGSVGILSWYSAQVAVMSELVGQRAAGIHVGSVATAQGGEWDYVLLSTVRRGGKSASGRLGIVSDPHILNVAITRARLGLVVLGDPSTLANDPHWQALLEHSRQHGSLTSRGPSVSSNQQLIESAWQRSLNPGLRVVLHGLQASPELNGQLGTITALANPQGRWEVEIKRGGDSRRLLLKPGNLRQIATEAIGNSQKPPVKKAAYGGLSALVAAERPGGSVEFSINVLLNAANLEVCGPSCELQQGASVRVVGLESGSICNGSAGTVRSKGTDGEGRWDVEVSKNFCMQQTIVQARPGKRGLEVESLAATASQLDLSIGVIVMLHGLKSQAAYNGEWGMVTVGAPNAEGRWEVEIWISPQGQGEGERKRLLLRAEHLAPEVP